jgi:hypothetical protein
MRGTQLPRSIPGNVALTLFILAVPALAQTGETRTLQVDSGASVAYVLRKHPADAHLARPAKDLAPTSALDVAKLLNLHLSTGDIEEAALLSNAPRRRFEVLRDYRESVGEEEFKRVFAQYFLPENRLVAEIVIDKHRLLVWELRTSAPSAPGVLAGQYFVEVDGRYFIDDAPNDTRTRLRWVLEAYRNGRLPR